MNQPSVYLSGPMLGCDICDCTNWRDYVTSELEKYNITCYSPMRYKKYQGDRIVHGSIVPSPITTDLALKERDRMDCERCDLIFVNLLGATEISIGTIMEIGWADAYRKPIVVVIGDSGNIHDHPLVSSAITYRANNIKDAIWTVHAVLLP